MKKLFFVFLLPIFFGCKKESTNSADPVSSPPDNFYIKGTVNGVNVNWSSENTAGFKADPMDERLGILSNDCNNTFCKTLGLTTRIFTQPVVNAQTPSTLELVFTNAAKTEDFTTIRSWLDPGYRPFAACRCNMSDISRPIHDGILIYYTDENRRSWFSDIRIADQDGSSFESVELKNAAPDKPYQKIWTARFSCKLYSTVSCPPNVTYESIRITDAEIQIPVFPK